MLISTKGRIGMQVEIRRLSPAVASDYIAFFDERAFSDGSINKGCYCVWHHWTDQHELARSMLPEGERPDRKRAYAAELIGQGKLNGFLAYSGGRVVGFCNADLKDHYFRLQMEAAPATWKNLSVGDRVLAIVCFVVAPDMRGQGVATALLQAACRYAEENGYDYVESYPTAGGFRTSDCCGPASMYEKAGFEIIEIPDGVLARKRCR